MHVDGGRHVKMWTRGVPVEAKAKDQLANTARMPFIFRHLAAMPDVHLGIGATVGSVLATKGAIIPAAVGVDIGCGMMATQTTLMAADLPDSLGKIRSRKRKPAPIGMPDLETAAVDPSMTERPETPERSLERRRDQESVYRALDQLAPKKRIVLYLHEIEGLDLKEIAYLVDSNPVTVRTRLFYARREFYKIIAGVEAAAEAGETPEEGGEP